MAASNDLLETLHEATATLLLDIIQNGVPVFDKDGNESGTRKASAAEISAAVAFLSKNDIKASLDDNEATKALAEALAARRQRAKPGVSDLLNYQVQ